MSSKSKGFLSFIPRAVILLFAGLVAMVLTGSIFMLLFVPIVGAYMWGSHDRIKALEARLSKLEKPAEETKPEQA